MADIDQEAFKVFAASAVPLSDPDNLQWLHASKKRTAMTLIILLVTFGVWSVHHAFTAAESVPQAERGAEIQRLVATIQDCMATWSSGKNYGDRKEEEAHVLLLLSKSGQASDAIEQLGKMKAVEAIPILIKHIEFSDGRYRTGPSWVPGINRRYRLATRALVEIGEASIQPVLEASKKEDDRVRLILMASVLSDVKGTDKASQLVESAISQTKDEQEKVRLEKLKSFIKDPPVR